MLAALLLSSSATLAQQPSGNPCAGDIKKLCAGVQPGDGRIKACIKSNLTGLSETCEERLLSVAVAGKVCKGDVAKLCAGVVPGTGGVRTCMPHCGNGAVSQTLVAGRNLRGHSR